jgi:trehalose 6-phosphate synthase/phosphatase
VKPGWIKAQFLELAEYDFVLALGDDKTDEDMFRALAEKAITIKVGSGHTLAQFNLTNQIEVIAFLDQLAKELVPLHA